MIAFTMIGTNDLAKAAAFYDALIAEMGGKRAVDLGDAIIYAGADGGALFAITEPADGNPATVGNGTMVALAAPDAESVKRWHAKALELGAENGGDAGERTRGPLTFDAAYFRDLDGNKLNFFKLH
ncbi:VOC family protein [Rubrimonas cliftonensis]|uniref:Glyoxalase/Bleomycin resistance protein/Dioxygenase superfamily protein n=1 Tax=Rubrimonas cliftonensis TaxID=89524 RepID=A0A1H4CF17_9RHOB|nr:VOC family protein [Rubrimonas cliftonensis]SEA58977.1 Glyoxalase/Bleomycin resistance protein/Dioxygenase superfamily protein [Rubrimonas cliftonensis]